MSTNFRPEDWISQAEAARLRGVSRQAVAKLVRTGRISTLELGGHVLIRRDEIVNFEPKKAGRPRNHE